MVISDLYMINLTYLIQNCIEKDPIVRKGLARGLISPTLLATHIKKSNPTENISLEALRTAIRRSKKELSNFTETQNKTDHVFKDSNIHLKSGIAKVSFQKGDASLELINRSIKTMEIYGGDTFRIIKGHRILHLLVDHENLDKIQGAFSERILNIEENLCEITINMPDKSRNTPGLFAAIIDEIALSNINIIEAFSCGTEINVFVEEKDSQETFNLLKNMLTMAKKEKKKKK